jgi:hypothetical protein
MGQSAEGSKVKLRDAHGADRHQRGITEKQLEKFYTLRGKRFDYIAFAKKHNISLDWLSLGTLDLHPRIPAPVRKNKSTHSAA